MSFITESALKIGFDACGVAPATALPEDADYLKEWLTKGFHGDMEYMSRNFEKRTDPRILVPGCKSVVVVLLNYYPPFLQPADAPQIAKYTYSRVDYHYVMKEKLNQLESLLCQQYGSDCVNQDVQHSFVDSAPILERRWAQRAGLGWIGKNKQLIAPGFGSFVFLGILLLNIETNYNSPIKPRCGSCTRCIDHCPTKALTVNGLDARKCISYLTVEQKDPLTPDQIKQLSGYVAGCDLCADCCPWNKKWAYPYCSDSFLAIPELSSWSKEDWLHLDKASFKASFGRSALTRTGFYKISSIIFATKKKKQS